MGDLQAFDVQDMVTIVTGAASGIGLAYAEAMADGGARVTLLDIDPANLAAAVDRLTAAGRTVRGEVVDATDREALRGAFDRAARHYGRLDVVFANVGGGAGPGFLSPEGERCAAGALENIPDSTWDHAISLNLTAVFTSIAAAVRHMKKQPSGGRIVVTTSIAASYCEPIVGTPYMAAKAGAAHLVRHAALELAKFGIRVNSIAPGPFITSIGGGRLRNPADRAAFEAVIPLRRMGNTEEIKALALFLASDASSFVTGSEYIIDGGNRLGRGD